MRPMLVLTTLLAACGSDFGVRNVPTDPDLTNSEPPPTTAAEGDSPPVDTGLASDTGAEDPVEEPPPEESVCDPTTSWVQTPFLVPQDALTCTGDQYVHYDAASDLWVGVVTCTGTEFVRLYLSELADGPYFQALDLAGHGQDHCQLLDPAFTIPVEDDITSGGCSGCATSMNLPVEGVPGFARAFFGEPFTFYASTGEWSWQTSQLDCDVDLVTCIP